MSTKARKYLPLWASLTILLIVMLFAQTISPALAAGETVTVNLAVFGGAPTYRASGFIYGIAADGSNPPNTTLSDIKTKSLRVGGAQIGCPNGGWINGQYTARWNAVKAYYTKAKAIGAKVLLLPHDLWGADGQCTVPRYPGASGNWTEYTNFMTQVINDAIANGMTGSDVRWELWNEPDLTYFWGGTQAQWLEMWKRGYQQVRAAIPGAVFEGPSLAGGPGSSWMGAFLDYVKTNNVVPNYMAWHEEGGGNDPVSDLSTITSALSSRSMTVTGYDVNEYGTSSEQNPGHSAWFIARLERTNMDGLRGNWGMAGGLYQGMGDLVTSSWQPLGQWWIYKRYGDQTGLRASVTPSSNNQIDAVAFIDSAASKSIIVVGNKGGTSGNINVQVNGIPAYLQSSGATHVLVEKMPTGTTYVSAPTVVSNANMSVSGNALTIAINWATATDGYTITLTPGTGSAPTNTPMPPTATPGGPVQYEAENGSWGGGASVATDHTGYTGTGFVAFMTAQGSYSQFTVTAASAGSKSVTLRYSAGPNGPASNRTMHIYVNGVMIRQSSMTRTTDWNTWATKVETLTLNAGSNTIKYQYDSGDTGYINSDNIIVQ